MSNGSNGVPLEPSGRLPPHNVSYTPLQSAGFSMGAKDSVKRSRGGGVHLCVLTGMDLKLNGEREPRTGESSADACIISSVRLHPRGHCRNRGASVVTS